MGIIYRGMTESNQSYSLDEYYKQYPQFKNLIPGEVVEMYVNFAHNCIKESQWHNGWKVGMGLFISHFLTLYLQSRTEENSPEGMVIAAGEAKGLKANKAVDGVSVSYDFATAMQDLTGWAAFKLTSYGTQFATLARLYSIGMAYVW